MITLSHDMRPRCGLVPRHLRGAALGLALAATACSPGSSEPTTSTKGTGGAGLVDGGGPTGAGGAVAGGGGSASSSGSGGQPDAGGSKGGGAAGGFVHPGILVNKGQLDFLKAKVSASADPWKSAFDKAKSSTFGSPSYTPHPLATVECGPYSNPDIGCSAEKDDVAAAYTHALLWYLTGDEAHAKTSIAIMNAWSAVLKAHTNSNAPLQSAWCASVFPRAAEIIRYTYAGWAAADIASFESMLKNVYLPEVIHGAPNDNGNWELSMAEASIAIGVFLDDKATFDAAVSMWKKRVPAYVYLQSDGPQPVPPPGGNKTTLQQIIGYWQNQSKFVDGLCQETCRDFGHVQLGFAAMIDAAETARIQGVDLYGAESKRITAGYELHAQYLDGAPVPSWLCGGTLSQLTPRETWEIGYNEYVNRANLSLPSTKAVVTKVRPTGVNHMMVWETLTHAAVGSVGLP